MLSILTPILIAWSFYLLSFFFLVPIIVTITSIVIFNKLVENKPNILIKLVGSLHRIFRSRSSQIFLFFISLLFISFSASLCILIALKFFIAPRVLEIIKERTSKEITTKWGFTPAPWESARIVIPSSIVRRVGKINSTSKRIEEKTTLYTDGQEMIFFHKNLFVVVTEETKIPPFELGPRGFIETIKGGSGEVSSFFKIYKNREYINKILSNNENLYLSLIDGVSIHKENNRLVVALDLYSVGSPVEVFEKIVSSFKNTPI